MTKIVASPEKPSTLLPNVLRLKLTTSTVASTAGVTHASLPPKQRIKLYQPRSKLEQFEDILIESQLLEARYLIPGTRSYRRSCSKFL
jgi:hypothetical protein